MQDCADGEGLTAKRPHLERRGRFAQMPSPNFLYCLSSR